MVVKHDTGNHWLDLPDFYAAVSMMDVVFCQEIYLSLTVIFTPTGNTGGITSGLVLALIAR